MELYYDKTSQKLAMIKSDSNELVFESEKVIGWHRCKDINCGCFYIRSWTNFYPTSPHREYIWIDIFVHGAFFLPISEAYSNGKFDKSHLPHADWRDDANKSFHSIIRTNHNQTWGGDYEHELILAFADARDFCNDYQEKMLREVQKLTSCLKAYNMGDKPYYLYTLLELTDNWYKANPRIAELLQPFLDNYCYDRMALLINKMQNIDDPSNSEINIANLLKNGDLYWNHIKSHALPEFEVKGSNE